MLNLLSGSTISIFIPEISDKGFKHEQARPDREQFVKIFENNIEAGKEHNFEVCKSCSEQNLPYDFDSLMHYTNDAFGKWVNGKRLKTIEVKSDPSHILAHSSSKHTFSPLDLAGILDLYDCSGKNPL